MEINNNNHYLINNKWPSNNISKIVDIIKIKWEKSNRNFYKINRLEIITVRLITGSKNIKITKIYKSIRKTNLSLVSHLISHQWGRNLRLIIFKIIVIFKEMLKSKRWEDWDQIWIKNERKLIKWEEQRFFMLKGSSSWITKNFSKSLCAKAKEERRHIQLK